MDFHLRFRQLCHTEGMIFILHSLIKPPLHLHYPHQRFALADLRWGAGAHTLGAQILSISCNFWENWAKSYVGVTVPSGLLEQGSWARVD